MICETAKKQKHRHPNQKSKNHTKIKKKLQKRHPPTNKTSGK
jgi:hypothetical protein